MPSGLLVGGQWMDQGDEYEIRDKFSGAPAAVVRQASAEHVDAAVSAGADRARHSPLSAPERAGILRRAADVLMRDRDLVITDYITETGFTRRDAVTEFTRACETLRLSAEEGLRLSGEMVPVGSAPGSERRLAFTIRVPVGIVAAIVPFNAPLNTLVHKVGPAIAAGNAVIIKPAELTPLSAIHVCEALMEAGLPDGWLSLLPGPGETVGRWLVEDSRIRYFTFTGSTAVGLFIKQHSGLAKTHLELGANSATIVCADADLENVVGAVVGAGYRKAGQVCTSVQRLLVEQSVAGALEDALHDRLSKLAVGDPRAAATAVGPMISVSEAERATSWVTEAAASGTRVRAGGTRSGSLMSPTLLADISDGARIMRDEIFAPVVALRPVSGLDEAIAMTNGTRYGLQAGIFTSDLGRAFHAAYRLDVGGVMVNDTSSYHADLMPYGGVKDSGIGLEGPRYAVQDMTETRIVVFNNIVPSW